MPDEMKPVLSAMFGLVESTSTATEVRGLAASAGVATGIARLIANLDDADRLGDGDVLVTQTTSPPWTPLFGIASAVVTDAGGPMSHVSIVAREYGIPAVVGAVDATKLIRDGQRVRGRRLGGNRRAAGGLAPSLAAPERRATAARRSSRCRRRRSR